MLFHVQIMRVHRVLILLLGEDPPSSNRGREHLSCHGISFSFPPLINSLIYKMCSTEALLLVKGGVAPHAALSPASPLACGSRFSGRFVRSCHTPRDQAWTGRPPDAHPFSIAPPAVWALDHAGPKTWVGGRGEAHVSCLHPWSPPSSLSFCSSFNPSLIQMRRCAPPPSSASQAPDPRLRAVLRGN